MLITLTWNAWNENVEVENDTIFYIVKAWVKAHHQHNCCCVGVGRRRSHKGVCWRASGGECIAILGKAHTENSVSRNSNAARPVIKWIRQAILPPPHFVLPPPVPLAPQTVCGVVDVPNIVDASVYYGFAENRMVLSFDAETPGQSDDGGARVDRYRTELVLAGGVARNMVSPEVAHETVESAVRRFVFPPPPLASR